MTPSIQDDEYGGRLIGHGGLRYETVQDITGSGISVE